VAGSVSYVGALEELWRALKDNYPAMELVGAAGDGWLEEYRPRARAAGSARDAYTLMDELVCRLSDYHTRLTWPDMPPMAGPPVEVLVVPRKRPSAPASVARDLQLRGFAPVPIEMPPMRDEVVAVSRVEGVSGLRPGDLVAAIDGVPVEQALASAWRHSCGSSRGARLREACWRMLLGAPGSELRLGVRRGSSEGREARVRRDGFRAQPNVSVTEVSGIPVVRIRGWGDSPGKPLVAEVDAILERYRDSRGIVFDVRGNGGGDDALADQVTGRFLSHSVVSSVSFHRKVPSLDYERTTEWAKPRGPWRFEGRAAVLTDEACRSACEHFVSGMAEAGAMLCGSSTDGACGWIRPVELSGGARLYVSRTLPLHTGGVPSPMLGIVPHLWLPPTLPDLRAGRDAALTNAVEWVRSDAPLPARPLARYDGE
jgi:carboxyl-terminal processing protease